MSAKLPPGPRMPAALQTLGNWSRPVPFLMNARRRYGKRFTLRLIGQGTIVVISDPEQIKEVFQAPPDVLHPGEGAKILEPIVGPYSVILLDEAPHMEQRKLLLPAFHGERMQALAGLMRELAEREVSSWPVGEPFELHSRLQALTLEIILRTVFGLEQGSRLERLSEVLTQMLSYSESPFSLMPPLPGPLAGIGPFAAIERLKAESDAMIFDLIDERRREGAGGEDVLGMLLAARHEDGSEMSPQELRDELITALVAGHETTASQLAWAFSRLAREPEVLARLQEELDSGEDEEYLAATVHEIMRLRPVIPNAEPRLVKQPVEIGGWLYEPGTYLFASAYLVHHDADIYPEPFAMRPERFLETPPGTYTWIPFGGGRRRCIGASFSLLEMRTVLRAALSRFDPSPATAAPDRARRRAITLSPSSAATVVLSERTSRSGVRRAAEAVALPA